MVLVDTSVWVDHLRKGHPQLAHLLEDGDVVCHSLIMGELACGNLNNREKILSLLEALPQVTCAEHEEVMDFITCHKLMGKGLGYIDICLLASSALDQILLWTLDKKLALAAKTMKLKF